MSQADRIRLHVHENHIVPARQSGRPTLEIRAGDVHAEMGLVNAMPAVCSALRGNKFENLACVTTASVRGPQFGANVFFTFVLTPAAAVPGIKNQNSPQLRASGRPNTADVERYSNGVFLVSCVSSKLDRPAPARLLYQSQWFVKARAFADAHAVCWYILSAMHGIVSPEVVIAPYERTLNTLPNNERREWSAKAHAQLVPLLKGRPRIIFLAGQRYREFLQPALISDGFLTEVPMEGLRIGEQLAWLSAHT
jgi:hypothetical protein